jgi:hypothetical protein
MSGSDNSIIDSVGEDNCVTIIRLRDIEELEESNDSEKSDCEIMELKFGNLVLRGCSMATSILHLVKISDFKLPFTLSEIRIF